MTLAHRTLALMVTMVMVASSSSIANSAKVNVDGKVVLANIDRYPAHFRVGKSKKKKIAPKKASVLTPKQYPITLEVWSGTPGKAKWESKTIPAAGIYTLKFQRGRWVLAKPARKRSTRRLTTARSSRRPTYRRTTGARYRTPRRSRRAYYASRVPVLRRIAGDVLGVYRFVRDEEDRDLLRSIVIGREIDREIERDLLDRLDDMAVNLPADERRDFERSLSNLKNLSRQDLSDFEAATNDDWQQVRDELGDDFSDADWQEMARDFRDVQADEVADIDINELDQSGLESLDADVDLGDLDGNDVDISDMGGTLDQVDAGDFVEDVDIGEIGIGDIGGGGGFDGGIDAVDSFDAGGFDDFGGGGGFDDFGGGGFDDFGGGGFDDFGGGFDDF